MFGIGGLELAIILVVAFLFFGPDKLPEMARALGKFMKQFKQIQDEVTSTIRSEMYEMPDLNKTPDLGGGPAGDKSAVAPAAAPATEAAVSSVGSGWETEEEEESEE